MPSPVFISRPPAGFTLPAVVQGVRLAVIGGLQTLCNSELGRSGYVFKATVAVLVSVIVQLVTRLPIWLVQCTFWVLLFLVSDSFVAQANNWPNVLWYLETHVLAAGPTMFILAGLYFEPEMDELFMTSLKFIDSAPACNRQYHRSLTCYQFVQVATATKPRPIALFLSRRARQSLVALVLLALSRLPRIGQFILPVSAFYSFYSSVGAPTALYVFAVCLLLPPRLLMSLLSGVWGARDLVRELLAPYLTRIPFSRTEEEEWFRAREGILFGFGAAYYLLLLRVPFAGVLVYACAQASCAYLITKISDPPPHPSRISTWTSTQTIFTAHHA